MATLRCVARCFFHERAVELEGVVGDEVCLIEPLEWKSGTYFTVVVLVFLIPGF